MKAAEIREMTNEDIEREIAEKQRALFNLRFQRETEQVERPSELRRARKDIARMRTILRERQSAEGADAAVGKGRSQKA